MEINIQVTIVWIAKTAMGLSFGPMVILIKESFVRICVMEKVRCIGVMEVNMKVSGSEDYPMAKVFVCLTKLGMFKAKGEKPRMGIF